MTERLTKGDTTPVWALKSIAQWYLLVCTFAYAYLMRGMLLGYFDRAIVDNVGIIVVGGGIFIGAIWGARHYGALGGNRLALAFFIASIAAALVGLDSVDPAFPAKRVHVAEYFILAWLVFAAFKSAEHIVLRGLIALIITAMLGGLDELLQGVMASRTYGLADMLTNTCGAFAGVMAACGALLLKERRWGTTRFSLAGGGAPIALAAGSFMSLAALYPFRGNAFPLWVLLPMAGGLALIAKETRVNELSVAMERFNVAVGVIALTALGGLVYVRVMGIRFL